MGGDKLLTTLVYVKNPWYLWGGKRVGLVTPPIKKHYYFPLMFGGGDYVSYICSVIKGI